MWWSGLPGLDAQGASGRTLADRATAIACADRISPLDPRVRRYRNANRPARPASP
jgi:hypothetical protein